LVPNRNSGAGVRHPCITQRLGLVDAAAQRREDPLDASRRSATDARRRDRIEIASRSPTGSTHL
jgi:hypothetical protein